MPNIEGLLYSLVPIALLLLALYWVVRTAVAAGIRSALPDSALRPRRIGR